MAALRSAVQAYKQEEELAGNIGITPVKRRRDIAQENTRNEDQPVPVSTRMKGVQFPFVVGDRVMIKGNKRTPDRFVGREAVITTHCLNGWSLSLPSATTLFHMIFFPCWEKIADHPSQNI